MGFWDNDGGSSLSGSGNKLDLIDYEKRLVQKFNDTEILNTKYKAEEFGITYKKKERESDVYRYEGETITICPEPLEFIKEFDEVSDNTSEAQLRFLEKIKTFQRLSLDKIPSLKGNAADGERMWMNKTLTGINLRAGNLNDDREDFTPVRMCDDNVHGLIAGRTGSGKSVFINALILSLITEYAPWELNLYLADFKKVELSRYMNNADEANRMMPFTPHVNACAATSEIRYVISLFRYLVDCMNARQEFFSRLGVTKLQEFRTKYNLVLPRVLLIVDEFQQLFMEATNRENEEIQTMLNSITKLGRATGFHLVFASQEMSGTLRGSTLANFKIRMALPCNSQVSLDILGNGRAANLERGYVLINTDSGEELQNKKYRVPFIETDKKDEDDSTEKTPFYAFLDEIKLAGSLFPLGYKTRTQKFYREELQETENDYRNDLDRIRKQKNELVAANKGLFDAVILGKSVLYSPKANDKVSFYIEKGRNKGIMIACPETDDAARVRKLLAENLLRSEEKTLHFGVEINNLVREKYRIGQVISRDYPQHTYYECDIDNAIDNLIIMYGLRQHASKIMEKKRADMQNIAAWEKRLLALRQDEKALETHQKVVQMAEIWEKAVNPAKLYFEKCSSELRLNGILAEFTGLNLYRDIVANYENVTDMEEAAQKSIGLLDKRIAELAPKSGEKVQGQEQNAVTFLRTKAFRRAILYFTDRYYNREPQQTSLSAMLKDVYDEILYEVEIYQERCEQERHPDEIGRVEKELVSKVSEFVTEIFEKASLTLGYRKNRPVIPAVRYRETEAGMSWSLEAENIDKEIYAVGNDILSQYIECCRRGDTCCAFQKAVFWLNGFDEIEKFPAQAVEVVRNAINQNILVVAIITSELKDSTVRKAFDYAFITGNIEKFYTMFDIRYTKQPLNSIVVNFGIRSKGFDIPFKMYKSNLEDIQAPDFIDRLLNE